MASASEEPALIDDARRWIASSCAALLNEGVYKIRVRLIEPKGDPVHASIYQHVDNRWTQTSYSVDGREVTSAVQAVSRMLASHPPTDSWHVRTSIADDFEDIDLQFHREAVNAHAGTNMLSWVTGALFKDAHASGQDRRRSPTHDANRRESR